MKKKNKKTKLKAWHLMPLSLLALLIAALFIFIGRGDFSIRQVDLKIEGPNQIENGKVETFKLIIQNNASKSLQDLNITLEVPGTLTIQEGKEELNKGIKSIDAGGRKEIEFKVVASSVNEKENINIRVDYSPEGISARFVERISRAVLIGKLDVSIVFDLPQTIYADQEIVGTIHIIPRSDIETTPIYLSLDVPEGFRIIETSNPFNYETVWKLNNLREEKVIKREFRGKLSLYEDSPKFRISLGKLEGISFLALNTVERSIDISESPLILEQRLLNSSSNVIKPGERVAVRISYLNKSKIPLEDAILKVSLPQNLVNFSSINSAGGDLDKDEGTIEWTKAQNSLLRFTDVEDGGNIIFSFNIRDDIEPGNIQDSNKRINIETTLRSQKESLVLNGAILQAKNKLALKLSTKMELQQDNYRQGGIFQSSGPHPPQANQFSTYTIRWQLTNTTNKVRSTKIEAVLPSYALWQNQSTPQSENIKYLSGTNTIVWDVGDLAVGVGFVYPQRTVEFQIAVIPEQADIQKGVNLLEQTKLSGIDVFTSSFVGEDLGKESVSSGTAGGSYGSN